MFFWQYKLLESLEVAGIRMVIGSTPVYGNGGMSEQVRCSAFDNEGCYHGEGSGLMHYHHNSGDSFGDDTIICLRDPPHSIGLAKDDGQDAFAYAPDIIYKTVNDIWRSARSGGASPGRSQEDTRLW